MTDTLPTAAEVERALRGGSKMLRKLAREARERGDGDVAVRCAALAEHLREDADAVRDYVVAPRP